MSKITCDSITDENVRLHQVHEDSLQQMLDCSSGFQATLDGRLLIIKDQLEEKKKTIRDLEDKVNEEKWWTVFCGFDFYAVY